MESRKQYGGGGGECSRAGCINEGEIERKKDEGGASAQHVLI